MSALWHFLLTRLAAIAAFLLLVVPAAPAADAAEQTRKLIAVLQSDSSLFEKARACQQLGEVGTPEAVPALAALLADPHLSAYARSGLEGIPNPSAAAALREAAQRLKGPLLTGVVNSLGVLRDAQAVPLLRQFATNPGSGVVTEAMLALGTISKPDSTQVIEQALASGPDATRNEAAAACLLAADRQRLSGNLRESIVLYDSIRQANVPMSCRVGATCGAILARKSDRVPFLIEQLRSAEPAIRNAALFTIREIPNDAVAAALNAELSRSTPERQGQLLLAIGDCHNEQSIPAVVSLANGSNAELRKTALQVLGKIGPGTVPALLRALQQARSPEEKMIVRDGLRAMPGAGVDDLLVKALISATGPEFRIDLIRLLDGRGVTKAAGEILKLAPPQEKGVSVAALSALKSLAGPGELPALMDIVRSSSDEAVRSAAENALAGVCSRRGGTVSDKVLNELRRAKKSSERNSWIRVLAQVGYAPALPAIEAAANDKDSIVAENALAQLGRWPDPAPTETLLKAMDSASNASLRKRALDSVIDLATTATDESQRSDAIIAGWLQRANASASSVQEKRRLLGILGRLKVIESFRLLVPYLNDPELRTEAAVAVVQIAPALSKDEHAGEVTAALEKIAAEAKTPELRERAYLVAQKLPARVPAKVAPAAAVTLKVAAVQFRSSFDVSENSSRMVKRLEELSEAGVNVAVFPECALTGYNTDRMSASGDEVARAEEQIGAVCGQRKIAVVFGSIYRINGRTYDTAMVINSRGELVERYGKLQLAGEKWATPGNHIAFFELEGVPSTVIVCHDERYPEFVRLPAMMGARVIYYVSSESGMEQGSKLAGYRAQMMARAVENGMFVVAANSPANATDNSGSHGQSRIIKNDGNILREASFYDDEVLTETLTIEPRKLEAPLKGIMADWWREGMDFMMKNRSRKLE
jgi:predicted amidohydrolase/HEAT repeat protein